MREIVLRTMMVRELAEQKPARFRYATECRNIVMYGRVDGYTHEESLALRSLVQKLKQAVEDENQSGEAQTVLLEEDEHKALVKALVSFRRKGYSDAAVEMVEEIKAAPVVEVEVKKKD